MARKLTKSELQERAPDFDVDPDQSYERLHQALPVKECRNCGDEYLGGLFDPCCSESCEIEFRSENYG